MCDTTVLLYDARHTILFTCTCTRYNSDGSVSVMTWVTVRRAGLVKPIQFKNLPLPLLHVRCPQKMQHQQQYAIL